MIWCETDPMNPLCDIWTFKGSDRWYWTREEAEEAFVLFRLVLLAELFILSGMFITGEQVNK